MEQEHTRTLVQEDDIAQLVKQILARQAVEPIDPDLLTDDEMLSADRLSISSLSFISVIISLEEAINIRFDDSTFLGKEFLTVGDLIRFIKEITNS